MGEATLCVNGVRKKDGKWDAMAEVKAACDKAGIDYPREVKEYFKWPNECLDVNWEEMHEVDIESVMSTECYNREMIRGFTFRVADIPEDIKEIKVYISYD